MSDQIIGQDVHVPGDGDDVAPCEPRAREPWPAAFADGNLAGENGLNTADAPRDKDHGRIEAMLVKDPRLFGDLDYRG